jgi:hypothetical protein
MGKAKLLPTRPGKVDYSFGGGADQIFVNELDSANYRIDTAGGNDFVESGAGNDTLIGGEGSDYIKGGRGDDLIYGGLENADYSPRKSNSDTLVGDMDGDFSIGYSFGNDTIWGATGASNLTTYAIGDADYIGGSLVGGSDSIHGGSGQNFLYGDVDNYLYGSAVGGDDTILSGSQSSGCTAYGDANTLYDSSRGGNDDIYTNNSGENVAYGDAVALYDSSTGGNDRLFGGYFGSSNQLHGDAHWMYGNTTGGNDQLYAQNNAGSSLYGDAQYVEASGGTITLGDDYLLSNNASAASGGTFYLYGDAVEAYAYDGTILCGDDTLIAGKGADYMWGDADLAGIAGNVVRGADTFEFDVGIFGADRIYDYQAGVDHIVLYDIASGDISVSTATWDSTDDSTLISFTGGGSVLLIGVTGFVASSEITYQYSA